jgi:cell wall-associated NlpC family hydrolase
MKYGVCPISIAPLRLEANDTSEMVSQVLYGEHFKVVESRAKWSKIRLAHDSYEGWMDNNQFIEIESEQYHDIDKNKLVFQSELITYVTHANDTLSMTTMGAQVSSTSLLADTTTIPVVDNDSQRTIIIKNALILLNSPYLWGGRSPLGIDCSGFTQLVYRLGQIKLLRDASQQATQGEFLSFIEEAENGDLAFFDNNDGKITHVGLIINDNYIIHAHGKVRIDMLDQSGIFNLESKKHTHKLRMIKKIIP